MFCYDEGVTKQRSRRAKKKSLPPRSVSHQRLWFGSAALLLLFVAGVLVLKSGHAPIKHIVLLSIDTLRADHLSCYGYERETTPHIDKIAEKGILFANVIAPSSWTAPSMVSLFTSTYPVNHGVVHGLDWRRNKEYSQRDGYRADRTGFSSHRKPPTQTPLTIPTFNAALPGLFTSFFSCNHHHENRLM